MSALAELVAEHGESALRALGGRRGAEKVLAEADPASSMPELVALLRDRAGVSAR
jgi:hypothetical protein